ncbi:retrotransposon protein, putative, ty1-copia subclass [Tanacetum coccineum]
MPAWQSSDAKGQSVNFSSYNSILRIFLKSKSNQISLLHSNQDPNLNVVSISLVIGDNDPGIAPVTIIDRQLPFEYTITSRSTDVVVLVLPVQNINHSAFRSMFEREARKLKQLANKRRDLIVGLILNGLTKDFSGFVKKYNMHNMGKTVGELHAMLIEYEKGLPKKAETPQVMMIKGGKIQKANKKSLKAKGKGKVNGKEKDKQVYIPTPKNPKPSAKEYPAKDDACHHCKEVGHWKRNCPVYLAELLKKKKHVGSASSSGILTIELFAFPNKSWVYDTGCGTNICITKHGFREARKLKQGALYLYMGNGVRAQVEAIVSYDLVLPNGLVICFDNCHYAPSILRGVVSVHRLVENGFVQCFTNFGISVSKNNAHYFNAIPSNGIYEIDMHNLVPNVNSIYNVSTKRAKHNLDSTYLWHCHLAHISKMTRKSFPHHPKRATDLLGIIHIDVYLEEIQDEDTSPSEITSEIPMEVEGFEPPQEEDITIRRSERTPRAPNRLSLNVEVEEHSLGDINEPTSYKAALLYSESNKWIDAMNAEIQSRGQICVWVLPIFSG